MIQVGKRGPYAKGTAKREEILDVALEVVAEHGCRGATNREIAKRAGLTQAGLKHYFGTREDLYLAVLQARDRRDDERYFAPAQTFEGFLDIIAHNAEVPGLVQLYVEFAAEASIGLHPAHDFFTERYAWVRQRLAQAVRTAQASGEFGTEVDVEAVTDIIIAAADGLQQQWLLDRSIDMVGRLRRLWDGIGALSRAAGDADPDPR